MQVTDDFPSPFQYNSSLFTWPMLSCWLLVPSSMSVVIILPHSTLVTLTKSNNLSTIVLQGVFDPSVRNVVPLGISMMCCLTSLKFLLVYLHNCVESHTPSWYCLPLACFIFVSSTYLCLTTFYISVYLLLFVLTRL